MGNNRLRRVHMLPNSNYDVKDVNCLLYERTGFFFHRGLIIIGCNLCIWASDSLDAIGIFVKAIYAFWELVSIEQPQIHDPNH